MLRLRTKLSLLAIGIFGLGIGALSGIADGAYSAVCLFVLPILVALAGAAIISDFNSPAPAEVVKPAAKEDVRSPVWTERTSQVMRVERTSQ